jgi:hypothetical protein
MIELRRTRGLRRLWPGRLVALPLAGLAIADRVLLASSGSDGAVAGACPSVNRPNMLKIAAGSPQTAPLEKPSRPTCRSSSPTATAVR